MLVGKERFLKCVKVLFPGKFICKDVADKCEVTRMYLRLISMWKHFIVANISSCIMNLQVAAVAAVADDVMISILVWPLTCEYNGFLNTQYWPSGMIYKFRL